MQNAVGKYSGLPPFCSCSTLASLEHQANSTLVGLMIAIQVMDSSIFSIIAVCGVNLVNNALGLVIMTAQE